MKIKNFILILFILLWIVSIFAQDYQVLDSMDSTVGWQTYSHSDRGSKNSVLPVAGKVKSAVRMSFDLGGGDWAVIVKELHKNLEGLKKIKFYYRYDGLPNFLEVKIADEDGSVFLYKDEITVTDYWKELELDISQFIYGWGGDNVLNLANVKQIEFGISRSTRGGGSGYLDVDEVKYIGKTIQVISEEPGVKYPVLVIDEFERLDPLTMYVPIKEDDSKLNLGSSRQYVKEGNYSMELEYELRTIRSYPSSVSALWEAKEPLNWSDIETLGIWVKGDGSGNIFRISIIDGTGEVYSYDDNQILFSTEYKLLSIPIEKFKISKEDKKIDGVFNKEKILGYKFTIIGRNTDISSGKIYIDHFYGMGKELTPSLIIPSEVRVPVTLLRPQGNIDLKGFGRAEYKSAPLAGSLFGAYYKIYFEAKLSDKFGMSIETCVNWQEFGEAAAINADGTAQVRDPYFNIPAARLYIIGLLPYLNYINIGNLWIDFSDYTFSGRWGYKGIEIEGRVGDFSIKGFGIKHRYDSWSYGFKADTTTYWGIWTRGIFVKYSGRARVQSDGTIIDGVIDKSKAGELKTERVEDDIVYNFELNKNIIPPISLRLLYGQNLNYRYAEADFRDPFNPVYSYRLYPVQKKKGDIKKLELEFREIIWREMNLFFQIRDVDENYKPKYRVNPGWFDECIGDQIGFRARVAQGYQGYVFSFEFDKFKRKGETGKFRNWFNVGIDKYNLYGFDLFLHYEYERQDDAFYRMYDSYKSYINEKIRAYIFRILYRFSSRAYMIDEIRLEDIYHPETGKKYSSGIFYGRYEYYIWGSNKFILEGRFSRFGHFAWHGNSEDTYFSAAMEVQF